MAKKREILVGIKSGREATAEALRAWKRAEKKLPPESPVNRLYFEDMATLLKYLSPGRVQLLQLLRAIGPTNIRKLALTLKRDYKNVYTDVADLKFVGLIKETKKNQISVPWDEILAKLPLFAKAV